MKDLTTKTETMKDEKYLDHKSLAASLIYTSTLAQMNNTVYVNSQQTHQKSPLSKKQSKSRAKSKNAKKSRKNNRKK